MDPLLGAQKVPGRGRCQAGLKAKREAQGPKTGAQPWEPVRGAPLPPHMLLLLLAPSRSSLQLEQAGKCIQSTSPCPSTDENQIKPASIGALLLKILTFQQQMNSPKQEFS